MPDKLEVLPGPGLVARFREVAVWAGPQASSTLQAHLVSEAQRAAQSPGAGDVLANSLIAVLQRGDPEPQSPFAVVGPGANGLTLFLHGPVQAWDSGRWLVPQPVPGWMVTAIGRPWPLIILPYAAPPPPQSQPGNPFDLVSGAVPGTGFILLRPSSGQAQASPSPGPIPAPTGTLSPGPGPASSPFGPPPGAQFSPAPVSPAPVSPAPVSPAPVSPAPVNPAPVSVTPGPGGSGPSAGMSPGGSLAAPAAGPGTAPTALASSAPPAGSSVPASLTPLPGPTPAPASGGSIDLRLVAAPAALPLPLAGAGALSSRPDRPEIVGIACARGHLNHPRATICARCGSSFPVGYPQVSGPRPAVGILLADDGSIWSLDGTCLIGADPSQAPEVQSGLARMIAMRPGSNHTMAPVQAEIQVRGWDAYLVDRGAEGGTQIQGPAVEGWSQLSRNEQRELTSGSHLSCGGRVLTYLSAWPS